jgi:hypothetical protein
MRRTALSCIALLAACAGATAGGRGGVADPASNPSQPHPPGEPVQINAGASPADAALMTGLAVGSSVAQRKSGGCYANCPPGTTCNSATGLCEDQPCHGRGGTDQTCDTSGPFPQCVARLKEDLKIRKEPGP